MSVMPGAALARIDEIVGEPDRVQVVVGVVMREIGEHL